MWLSCALRTRMICWPHQKGTDTEILAEFHGRHCILLLLFFSGLLFLKDLATIFFFFSFPSLSTPVLSVTLPLIVNTKIPAYRETWWGCVCLLAYSDIVGKFFLLRLITQSSKGHLVRFFLSNSTSHKPRRIVYSSRRRFLIFLFSYTKEFFKGFTQCCQ